MKKVLRILISVLVIMVLAGTAVFAMDAVVKATTAQSDSVFITPYSAPASEGSDGTAITESGGKYADPAYYNITYRNDSIITNGQYLILMVKTSDAKEDGSGSYTITESSLIYINQVAAKEDGSVTFEKVYPMSLTDSYILISGTGLTNPVIVGYVDVQGMLGDVDLDGIYTATDALYALQIAVGKGDWSDTQKQCANVDDDTIVTATDALYILQAAVGKRTLG